MIKPFTSGLETKETSGGKEKRGKKIVY